MASSSAAPFAALVSERGRRRSVQFKEKYQLHAGRNGKELQKQLVEFFQGRSHNALRFPTTNRTSTSRETIARWTNSTCTKMCLTDTTPRSHIPRKCSLPNLSSTKPLKRRKKRKKEMAVRTHVRHASISHAQTERETDTIRKRASTDRRGRF